MTPVDWQPLQSFDVFPVNFALEVFRGDSWRVDLIVLLDSTDSGHEAASIWTYEEPYDPVLGDSQEELERIKRAALTGFANRLHMLLT